MFVERLQDAGEIGGIIIPEKSREDCRVFKVLAVGPECGTRYPALSAQYARSLREHRNIEPLDNRDALARADHVLLPREAHAGGIWRMPWQDFWYIVHESEVLAVVRI